MVQVYLEYTFFEQNFYKFVANNFHLLPKGSLNLSMYHPISPMYMALRCWGCTEEVCCPFFEKNFYTFMASNWLLLPEGSLNQLMCHPISPMYMALVCLECSAEVYCRKH